jgi:tRNA threonylcarbamoyladenosine biosynthesis protein TsaB
MLTLAVDTSTRGGSLAVLADARVLGHRVIGSGEPYSQLFCASVDSLLEESNIALSQLDLFAVAAGPGSFTGLRIGLTAVKAWAEVFQKPIAAVSVLESIAAQVPLAHEKARPTLVGAVLDARRGQVFGGLYRYAGDESGLSLVGEEVVSDPGDFLNWVRDQENGVSPILASPTPEVFASALAASSLRDSRVEKVSAVLAPVIGLIGYRQALRGDVVDALHLDASYVRRTDAELKWKD